MSYQRILVTLVIGLLHFVNAGEQSVTSPYKSIQVPEFKKSFIILSQDKHNGDDNDLHEQKSLLAVPMPYLQPPHLPSEWITKTKPAEIVKKEPTDAESDDVKRTKRHHCHKCGGYGGGGYGGGYGGYGGGYGGGYVAKIIVVPGGGGKQHGGQGGHGGYGGYPGYGGGGGGCGGGCGGGGYPVNNYYPNNGGGGGSSSWSQSSSSAGSTSWGKK